MTSNSVAVSRAQALTKPVLKTKKTKKQRKRYICQYCNKELSQKCNLESHLRVHTGERPYQCDVCPLAFKHLTNLTRHRKRIHGLVGKVPNAKKKNEAKGAGAMPMISNPTSSMVMMPTMTPQMQAMGKMQMGAAIPSMPSPAQYVPLASNASMVTMHMPGTMMSHPTSSMAPPSQVLHPTRQPMTVPSPSTLAMPLQRVGGMLPMQTVAPVAASGQISMPAEPARAMPLQAARVMPLQTMVMHPQAAQAIVCSTTRKVASTPHNNVHPTPAARAVKPRPQS
uniref:C2H2-type domain-containing protein n=1 Tax=Lotharella oceanica TaxID=641309 RepID=A0A7S2TKD7_9EUKA|mmetsp:Transcript_18292/g.34612  ORF Transcript_18292/g.34612 Transcript_18292/m.34612 type:complete len:282 (+) Transcript_18292:1-846(+)